MRYFCIKNCLYSRCILYFVNLLQEKGERNEKDKEYEW